MKTYILVKSEKKFKEILHELLYFQKVASNGKISEA